VCVRTCAGVCVRERGPLSSLLLIKLCVCVSISLSSHQSFTSSANFEAGVAAEVVESGGGGGSGGAVRQI